MRPRRSPQHLDPDHTPSRTAAGLGAALGAGAAALISAGLVYWIGSGGDPTLKRIGHASPTPAYAPSEPDAGQVVRAYEQLKEIYAARGAAGVAGFARGCAQSLTVDPSALDFCIAFDIYAASVIGDDETARAWRANATARDLALARAALAPTADPVVRLARIREFARQVSLRDPDLTQLQAKARPAPHRTGPRPARRVAKPAAEPADPSLDQPAAQVAAATAAEAKPARPAVVNKPPVNRAVAKRPPAAAAAEGCGRKVTAGERAVCASPALRQADAELQAAYRKAVAAGANPIQLAREQARFRRSVNAAAPDRVALERLYYQRTRDLEGLSEGP